MEPSQCFHHARGAISFTKTLKVKEAQFGRLYMKAAAGRQWVGAAGGSTDAPARFLG